MAASLLGGIGLFLLGMKLMTDGLRLAAGHALRDILARWTGTPLRGLLAGVLITALVQASGAVTVAVIGFVNAGLMTLGQAIMLVYGSNVGTTVTAWLVAVVGFRVDIKPFALPAIGAGMLMRLLASDRRLGAAGETLAGIGVFFLGIDVLKTSFEGLGRTIHLEAVAAEGWGNLLLFAGAGFLLTVLMQSSSAALAIILTAAGGAVLRLDMAAAMVIGANVGTTSTAALAVIGATPNAKRTAAAHVIFNLVTGAVALAILPFLLRGLEALQGTLAHEAGPATLLALFHTTFNVLGVAIMWPLTRPLVGFLERRFHSAEEDETRPQFLDRNIVGTPVLAMHALAMELARIGAIARRMARTSISSERAPGARLAADRAALDSLVEAAGEFSNLLQRRNLPSELDAVLPNALRVSRYYTEVAELAAAIATAHRSVPAIEPSDLAGDAARFKAAVVELVDAADAAAKNYSADACAAELQTLEEQYQELKSDLLRAGTQGRLPVRALVDQLELMSHIRRIAQQVEKGARYLASLDVALPAEPEP